MYQSKQQDSSHKRKRDDSELRIPDESRHFRAEVTCRVQRTTISKIRSTLTPEQLRLFERTCFGYLLRLPDTRFSGVLVHSFLLRQLHRGLDKDEFWFRINGVDVRFSPFEFALMTGLPFSRITAFSSYIPHGSRDRIRDTYFQGCQKVQYHDLERVFLTRPWGDDDIDAVKIALLYSLHMVLLGNDRRKKVSAEYLQLVDHLDKFNSYPWGVPVWKMTFKSMFQASDRICSYKMPDMHKYDIHGFPLAFQYWIYETLNTLYTWVDLVDVHASPRMFRWHTRDVPAWSHIRTVFTGDKDDVNFPLQLSPIEEARPWYVDIIAYTSMLDPQSPSSSSAPSSAEDEASPVMSSGDIQVATPERPNKPIQSPVTEHTTCPVVETPTTKTTNLPGVQDHATNHPTQECPSIASPIIPSLDVALARWGSMILREISYLRDEISVIKEQISQLEDCMTRWEDIVIRTRPAPVDKDTSRERVSVSPSIASPPPSEVPLMENPKIESSEVPSHSEGKSLLLEGSIPLKHVENRMVSIIETEKELEREICRYGCRIKKYEMALKVVDDHMTEVEQVLSQLQASTEPHILSDPHWFTKEEMSRQIQSKGHSASAALCCVGKEVPLHESRTDFMEDIVGVVSLIGKAWTRILSRMLAEYLGEDQMLALVCRSFRAACALEEYERNGEVNFSLGLHGKAAAHGKSIVGRFLVICLEDIRPYTGELDVSDPQRRLVLRDPILPCGNDPPGFMGYAVNMVDLDELHVYTRTEAGHGLRETLFYRLFGELQVYRTRKDMTEARACIKQGAISLDGGILKENGFISLGHRNPTICFPVVGHVELLPSSASVEKLNQIKQKKSELDELSFLKEKYTKALEKAFKKFNGKKEKYTQHMDEISPKLRDYLEYGKSKKQ